LFSHIFQDFGPDLSALGVFGVFPLEFRLLAFYTFTIYPVIFSLSRLFFPSDARPYPDHLLPFSLENFFFFLAQSFTGYKRLFEEEPYTTVYSFNLILCWFVSPSPPLLFGSLVSLGFRVDFKLAISPVKRSELLRSYLTFPVR